MSQQVLFAAPLHTCGGFASSCSQFHSGVFRLGFTLHLLRPSLPDPPSPTHPKSRQPKTRAELNVCVIWAVFFYLVAICSLALLLARIGSILPVPPPTKYQANWNAVELHVCILEVRSIPGRSALLGPYLGGRFACAVPLLAARSFRALVTALRLPCRLAWLARCRLAGLR
jgi:hypothetical protein